MQQLEQLGELDNTYIFYTSDNGERVTRLQLHRLGLAP